MRPIQSWNPLKELEAVQNHFANLFGNNVRWPAEIERSSFYPAVDISEDKEAFYFKVDLPEVKKEDINVECHNRVLTISGEKKIEKETSSEDKMYHRIERSYGTFKRSFNLPDEVNSDMINAEFKEGALSLKIAKNTSEIKSKKTITVQ